MYIYTHVYIYTCVYYTYKYTRQKNSGRDTSPRKANENAAKSLSQIMTLGRDMAYKTPPPPKKGCTAQGDN